MLYKVVIYVSNMFIVWGRCPRLPKPDYTRWTHFLWVFRALCMCGDLIFVPQLNWSGYRLWFLECEKVFGGWVSGRFVCILNLLFFIILRISHVYKYLTTNMYMALWLQYGWLLGFCLFVISIRVYWLVLCYIFIIGWSNAYLLCGGCVVRYEFVAGGVWVLV